MLDNRLLDCGAQQEISENFNRVLAVSDAVSGNVSNVAADVTEINHGRGIEVYVSGNSVEASIPTGTDFTALSLSGATVNDSLGGLTESQR